jgi:hypothetical protein
MDRPRGGGRQNQRRVLRSHVARLDPAGHVVDAYFDGADRLLIRQLKGYYALRGGMRSGSWEAYRHRSHDFLQFASFVLLVEMLELHGGPLKVEKVMLPGR